MGLVNRRGDFRPSTPPRPLNRFSWNLKYITISRTGPRMQNFRGYVDVGGLANSQFDAWQFLSFLLLHRGHKSHLWAHPHAQYVIIRRSRQGSAFWELERWNLKFDPFNPKNVKIGTLSWRSMANGSRPNSGTVSLILFKLGTRIDHPSGITWRDSNVKRSRVKVTM